MSLLDEQIVNFLGGKKALQIKGPWTPFAFHDKVTAGLPVTCVLSFKAHSGFNVTEVSEVLGITERTFMRWQKHPLVPLDPVASDRLYRTAKIMALAGQVLEDTGEARAWMNEPQYALDEKIPRELLTTDAGARQVEEVLNRIEHGYLA